MHVICKCHSQVLGVVRRYYVGVVRRYAPPFSMLRICSIGHPFVYLWMPARAFVGRPYPYLCVWALGGNLIMTRTVGTWEALIATINSEATLTLLSSAVNVTGASSGFSLMLSLQMHWFYAEFSSLDIQTVKSVRVESAKQLIGDYNGRKRTGWASITATAKRFCQSLFFHSWQWPRPPLLLLLKV